MSYIPKVRSAAQPGFGLRAAGMPGTVLPPGSCSSKERLPRENAVGQTRRLVSPQVPVSGVGDRRGDTSSALPLILEGGCLADQLHRCSKATAA